MKIWSYILSGIGFIFQYVVPIVLFGNVIPYTHESLEAGLTAMGYIAIAVLAIILIKKFKKKLNDMSRGFIKALFLSLIFPMVYWLIVKVGVNYLLNLFVGLAQYWGYIIIFIVIGGLFHVISGMIYGGDK